MEYVNLGRKLGIGTRIAAKILRDRTQKAGSAAGTKAPVTVKPPVAQKQPRAQAEKGPAKKQIDTRAATRNLTRGVAHGGRSFWKPFARVVHALWHEVTGVFFAIFALFFAQNLWRVRNAWKFGPEHHHFIIYLVFTLVFAYFSITAFVTSRRPKH
ncbi:MAG TPA: hypothetical protein VIJ53_02250 [Acidobacteriaceae bacterium]